MSEMENLMNFEQNQKPEKLSKSNEEIKQPEADMGELIDYVSISGGFGIYANKLEISLGGKLPRGINHRDFEQYLLDRVQKYRNHFKKILEEENGKS